MDLKHWSMTNVLEFMEKQPILKELQTRIQHMLDPDPAHDLAHCLRVALWTVRLNPQGDPVHSIAAALLHDIVNLPKNHPDRKLASTKSAALAREILESYDLPPHILNEICQAIQDHSYSHGQTPTSDLGKALQDADRLDALGIIGAFRNISCGAKMNAAFYHASDPWSAESKRVLDDHAYSMDHYPLKLLKLKDTMNTECGKREANVRTNRMLLMLQGLGDEVGVAYPL